MPITEGHRIILGWLSIMPWMMSERHCPGEEQHEEMLHERMHKHRDGGQHCGQERVAHEPLRRPSEGLPSPCCSVGQPCDSLPANTKQLPGPLMAVPGLRAMLLPENWQLCVLLIENNLKGKKNRQVCKYVGAESC